MRVIVCFLIAVLFEMNVNAKIITTDKIEVIESEFAAADGNTLIAFDCDEVLINPIDAVLLSGNEQVLNRVAYKYGKSLDKNSYINFRSIVLRDMKMHLLDDKLPLLIKVLQSRGIKTVLLTACATGKFGIIDSMEQWRRNQLLAFGIDFKKSWPGLQSIKFTKFSPGIKSSSGIPTFSDGMLFSGDISKGEVLRAFLAKIKNRKFNKVVFIDDKIENLKSVESISQILGIEFVGIEYTRSNTTAYNQLDMQKIEKQFDILIKEKKWLSCTEIEKNIHIVSEKQ